MNKLRTFSCLGCATAVGLLAVFAPTHAAEVKITWEEPETYSDVKPTNESRKRFRERTLEDLEQHIVELASDLPESQVLSMTVTNVDLAGQVWPSQFVGFGTGGGSDVRIIKRVDNARISFSYSLTDDSGKVLKSADVKLKDMSFLDNPSTFRQNEYLGYEKAMLKDWFDEEMADALAQN